MPSAFTPTKLWTFCLFKAHRDFNLLLRLSCDVAGADGYFSSIRAGLWSSVPAGPGQGSVCGCAQQPDLLHLCPLSPSPFQPPHSVLLTQWLVEFHTKWAWGAHKPIFLISLLLRKFHAPFLSWTPPQTGFTFCPWKGRCWQSWRQTAWGEEQGRQGNYLQGVFSQPVNAEAKEMKLSQRTKLWGSGFNVYSVSISTEIGTAAPRKEVWALPNSISPRLQGRPIWWWISFKHEINSDTFMLYLKIMQYFQSWMLSSLWIRQH